MRGFYSTLWPMTYLQLIINWLFYVESSLGRDLIVSLGRECAIAAITFTQYTVLNTRKCNLLVQFLMEIHSGIFAYARFLIYIFIAVIVHIMAESFGIRERRAICRQEIVAHFPKGKSPEISGNPSNAASPTASQPRYREQHASRNILSTLKLNLLLQFFI